MFSQTLADLTEKCDYYQTLVDAARTPGQKELYENWLAYAKKERDELMSERWHD